MLAAAPGLHGASLRLEVGRLAHPAFLAEGLQIDFRRPGGEAELALDRLTIGDRRWRGIRVRCPELRLDAGLVRCRGGSLALPGFADRAAFDLALDPGRRRLDLRIELARDEVIELRTVGDGVRAEARGLDLARLGAWLPELAGSAPGGRLALRAAWQPGAEGGALTITGAVTGGAFSSPDGLRAGEGLELAVDLEAHARRGGWDWRGGLRWAKGEAYLHPLYLTAGPALRATGRYGEGRLAVSAASVEVEGVRSIAANGVVDLSTGTLESGALALADADLAVIGPRYLAPLLAPAQAEALRFAGRLSAGLRVTGEGLAAIDAVFDQAAVTLDGKGLSFGPVSGELPWRRTEATTARLAVGGGRWQKLELGAFDVSARLRGEALDIERVRVPVLDGALVLHDLSLRRRAEGWVGRGGAVVEPVAMDKLTTALDLPVMSGTLAASLPGVTVAPGSLTLDGALVISVFDGYVQLTGLQVLEPFGVAPHAYANLEARHLDLAQITHTFDFGSITGYVDADVRSLELARWRPIRFDARVASSPGRYPRRISQRAVENISALGGQGATVAIQRSFLRFFETFGYREIGFSCVLAEGICRMGGIEGDAGTGNGGFRLVRGGGVPALNVIGYNRRVDWNELIDRLQQAIASNAAPVVR